MSRQVTVDYLLKEVKEEPESDTEEYHQPQQQELMLDFTIKQEEIYEPGMSSARHEKPKFVCKKCGKVLKSAKNLREHTSAVHSNLKQFVCDLCRKTFKYQRDRNRHKRTHMKPHVACDICGRTFTRKDLLKQHMPVHEPKSVKYECPTCKRAFYTKNGYYQHTKSQNFKCQLCCRHMKTENQFNAHVCGKNIKRNKK